MAGPRRRRFSALGTPIVRSVGTSSSESHRLDMPRVPASVGSTAWRHRPGDMGVPFTDIVFDDGTADALSSAATIAGDALTGMATGRSHAATAALEGFAGAYSKTFTAVCQVESEDRGRLARALHDLAGDVGEAKSAAARERARLEAREQWEQQQKARERDPFGLLTPTPSSSLGPRSPRTFAPAPLFQPSTFPVPAPAVVASFSASARERIATGSSGGPPRPPRRTCGASLRAPISPPARWKHSSKRCEPH
jgi:hypothetical protein